MVKRYSYYALTILLSICATSTVSAKDTPELRALAIGLENNLKTLEILDTELQPVDKLSLRPFAFSKSFTCPIIEGRLIFGIADGVDEAGNPKYKQIASFEWEESYEQVCLLFLPKSLMPDDNPDVAEYTVQVLDMNTKVFKMGHSKIVNLTPLETVVQVGEHEASIAAWDRAEFSKVEELTGVNMANISVSYLEKDTKHVAYQSRIRYSDDMRSVMIVYTDSRSERTMVRIIKDTGRLF